MKTKKFIALFLLFVIALSSVSTFASETVPLPDLVISEVYLSDPCFETGDVIDIYVTAENIGESSAARYDLYLLNMTNCQSKLFPEENLCGIWSNIQSINSGAKQTYRMSDVEVTSDTITFTAFADYSDWCIETDNANNSRAYTFTSLKNKSDINLKDIYLSPSKFAVGDTVTLMASVKNNGGAALSQASVDFNVTIGSESLAVNKELSLGAKLTQDIELTSFVFDAEHKDISVTANADDVHSFNNSVSRSFSTAPDEVFYDWRNVACAPGGLISGSFGDYTTGNIYFYTDVGGFYRYNRTTGYFEHMLTGLDHTYPHCCEGVTAKGDIIFAALNNGSNTGGSTYIEDSVLARTMDGGKTWQKIDVPVLYAGNGAYKNSKHLIQLDPNNSNILITGSTREGAYYTDNALSDCPSWRRIDFPGFVPSDYAEGNRYVKSIAFDPSETTDGKSKNIYIAVYAVGVYKSTDGGESFALMEGSPKNVISMRCSVEGKLYAASNGSESNGAFVYHNSTWTDITPVSSSGTRYTGFTSIDVSDLDSHYVAIGWEGSDGNGGARYSTDGGATWFSPYADMQSETVSHMTASRTYMLKNVTWDPLNAKALWTSNEYNPWYLSDVTQAPRLWKEIPYGFEELVMFNAVAPAGSDKIYYCPWDSALIMKEKSRIDDYPATVTNRGIGQIYSLGVDACRADPDFIVSVGGKDKYMEGEGTAGYSTDGGYTYTAFPTLPLKADGVTKEYFSQVAVSSGLNENGVPTVLCAPANAPLYRTDDLGETWTAVNTSLNAQGSFSGDIDLICDTEGRFYFYHIATGDLYMSEDDGLTFAKLTTVMPCTQRVLRAFETNKGYMALATGNALFISKDAGQSFSRVEGVTEATYIGIGKKSQYSEFDTLYLIGTVNNRKGIYRSLNLGISWESILDDTYMGGNSPASIDGDKDTFGTVYVGTQGRGVLIGEASLGDVDNSELEISSEPNVTTDKSRFTFSARCSRTGTVDVIVNGIKRSTVNCNAYESFEVEAGLRYGANTITLSCGTPGSEGYLETTVNVTYTESEHSDTRTYAAFGTVNVDGVLAEDEWNPKTVIRNVLLGSTQTTAVFEVKYDDSFLYLAADVYDEDALTGGDVLFNLYVDPDAERYARYDSRDKHIRITDSVVYDMTTDAAIDGAVVKYIRNPYGYALELKIPLEYLGIDTSKGYFAMEASFNDRDSQGLGKSGLLSWGTTYDPWRRATNFGICFFE